MLLLKSSSLCYFSGCRPRFARLAASPLPRACIAPTKSEEKERLLAVYLADTFGPFPGVRLIEVVCLIEVCKKCAVFVND